MNKIALFFMALCVVAVSCSKTVKVPVSYSVEADHDQELQDIYILDSSTTNVPIVVKFLTGYAQDPVTVSIHGLPSLASVSPDTFSAIPTYTKDFAFTTHKLPVGNYPITIVSSAPNTLPKTINANLVVIPNNCITLFLGDATGSNSCTGRDYTYTVTCNGTNFIGAMYIVNLGGYGVHTNTYVTLDCPNGTVSVPRQNIGNGVTIEGSGTFTSNKMVINYTAENVPGGGNETCTATLVK